MQIVRAVIGGILLFLGRELNFLFAGAMAALIGFRLTPLLPPQWPQWSDYAFMAGLALIAAAITIINERVGFFLSGFFDLSEILREENTKDLPIDLVAGATAKFVWKDHAQARLVVRVAAGDQHNVARRSDRHFFEHLRHVADQDLVGIGEALAIGVK